jgi:hypothetical protein
MEPTGLRNLAEKGAGDDALRTVEPVRVTKKGFVEAVSRPHW